MTTQPLPPSALPDTIDPPLSVVGTLGSLSPPRISPWEKFLKDNSKSYTYLYGRSTISKNNAPGAVIGAWEVFSLNTIMNYIPPGFMDYDFATNVMVDSVTLMIEPIKQPGSEVKMKLEYWYTSGGLIGNDNSTSKPTTYINYEEFFINDENPYKAFVIPYPMYEVPALNMCETQKSLTANYSLWPYPTSDVGRLQNIAPRLWVALTVMSGYRKTNLHPDEFDINYYVSYDPQFSGPHIPSNGGSSIFALNVIDSLNLGGWSNGPNMECFRYVSS